ncbi:MAG: hypothetical protein LBT40_13450 [Deltaproteobacteria bacterium]|jgi:hypothetical protein|nr:hypothetical protein [Deltaproteobacteria bacterium]
MIQPRARRHNCAFHVTAAALAAIIGTVSCGDQKEDVSTSTIVSVPKPVPTFTSSFPASFQKTSRVLTVQGERSPEDDTYVVVIAQGPDSTGKINFMLLMEPSVIGPDDKALLESDGPAFWNRTGQAFAGALAGPFHGMRPLQHKGFPAADIDVRSGDGQAEKSTFHVARFVAKGDTMLCFDCMFETTSGTGGENLSSLRTNPAVSKACTAFLDSIEFQD